MIAEDVVIGNTAIIKAYMRYVNTMQFMGTDVQGITKALIVMSYSIDEREVARRSTDLAWLAKLSIEMEELQLRV